MGDGVYQSVVCFFMAYLLFAPATFVTSNGLNVNDRERMGVYIACATIVVVNLYVLMNTYRWDWLMLLLVVLSIVLIWFWTGVYTAFTSSSYFYESAAEAYGQLSFWALSLLTVLIALLPRFMAKSIQKVFLPLDVDVIREQVSQGRFAYLSDTAERNSTSKTSSVSTEDISKPHDATKIQMTQTEDDLRPIYPPSVTRTTTTNNPHSQNGSDVTDYIDHRLSLEQPRMSMDRPRPSFDRMRQSMGDIRPSFENMNDFTSAAMLTRVESSNSHIQRPRSPHRTSQLR